MQVNETLSDGLRRQFRITLPAARIDGDIDRKLIDMSRSLKLPGFRPGKIPMPLLKKRYGQSVMGEVLQETIDRSTQELLSEKGLRPALQPKVDIVNFSPGADLEFDVDFETLPEVPQPDLAAITLERPRADVSETSVDEAIERLAKARTAYEPVDPPRPAADGDRVTIDFVGRVDGLPFEGGSAEGFDLVLGSGRFIPGFESQLVGAAAGDERLVQVTFPDEYPQATLKGRPAEFTVTVKVVAGPRPVAIDAELAKSVGVDSVDALRTAVQERLQRDYRAASRQKAKRALLDQLAATVAFTVPAGMVEAEFEQIWREVTAAKARGATDPESDGKSEDELKADYRAIADRRVRLGLLLSDIGRRNNIQVSEDEVRRAVVEQARQLPGREREVIEFYRANQGALDGLRAPIFEDKVVDFVLEMATVTDKIVAVDELFADAE
jgi:trigger factor